MKIKVPATSANLGPGFDTLGLAVGLYNYVTITPSSCYSVSIKGEGEEKSKLKVNNIFISIFYEIYQELVGQKDNYRFEFENNIPFSRGLGSSSAVIVGAIASAYEMAEVKVSKEIILNRALAYENHPDNIAPAVYGGYTSSIVSDGIVKTLKKDLPELLRAVVVIPDRPMSTAHSRTQLPKSYLMRDVVFNQSRVGLMSAAFFSEDWDMLCFASQDRMHENRRMKKLKELFKVREVALENKALMSTLSGSGSTFFNLCYTKDAQNLEKVLKNSFPSYRVETLALDNNGFEIIKDKKQFNFGIIMSAINKPIRMCILCRERFEQNSLLRFQVNNGKITEFSHRGRSFYICEKCLMFGSEKLLKLLNSKLRIKNKTIIEFGEYFSKIVQEHNKEILTNG